MKSPQQAEPENWIQQSRDTRGAAISNHYPQLEYITTYRRMNKSEVTGFSMLFAANPVNKMQRGIPIGQKTPDTLTQGLLACHSFSVQRRDGSAKGAAVCICDLGLCWETTSSGECPNCAASYMFVLHFEAACLPITYQRTHEHYFLVRYVLRVFTEGFE